MTGRRALERLAAASPVLLAAAGCGPLSSVLSSAGPQAGGIEALWWLFFWVCAAVYAVVLFWLGYALLHRRRRAEGPTVASDAGREGAATRGLYAWVGGTVTVLFALTFASFWTDRGLTSAPAGASLDIEVTANQWWWQIRYLDADPSRSFITANEIHVPVGTPVNLSLRSQDVIHSFWVPNLAGKQDLIPGRENTLVFTAEREGVYRGQCAEFCGLQHANMAIEVVAEPAQAFAAWREAQLEPAQEPADEEAKRGRDTFLASACVMCHSIRGTPAGGRTAPDLTHLASRRFIAAGTLLMSRGNLGAWIADPQTLKPGNHMPIVGMSADDFQSLLAFLDGLK